jgi:hypothetical protein
MAKKMNKHGTYQGKDPAITADQLWDAFLKYKEKAKATPFIIEDFVGKDGTPVNRKRERALTIEGFENYCADNLGVLDIERYMYNKGDNEAIHVEVSARIRKNIRQDQIEGAMAQLYHGKIVMGLNGISESTKSEVKVKKVGIDADEDTFE